MTSVLESLRLYLSNFTLASVIDELNRWSQSGRSCFEKLLNKLKLKRSPAGQATLDRLYPNPTPEPTG